VEKFSGLSPEEVRRATMLHLEHSAYDDLRSRDATTSEEQRPLEREETDPIYRVVAAPLVVNWKTPRSRAPRPRPTEATAEGALQSTATAGVIERRVRRRVATGLRSTSSERTNSGPPPTPAGRDVIKDDFGGKLPSGRRPDVRPHLRLPRGRSFIRGRVFTVRQRGKNRVCADAPQRPHERISQILLPSSLPPSPPLPSPLSLPPLCCPRTRKKIKINK
jgi:hypothetical protein